MSSSVAVARVLSCNVVVLLQRVVRESRGVAVEPEAKLWFGAVSLGPGAVAGGR